MKTLELFYNHKLANSLACALSYFEVKEKEQPVLEYKRLNQYETIEEATEAYYKSKKDYENYCSLGFTVDNMKELFTYT